MIRKDYKLNKLSTGYKTVDILSERNEAYRYGYMWRDSKLKLAPYISDVIFSFDGKKVTFNKYVREAERLFYTLSGGLSYSLNTSASERSMVGVFSSCTPYVFTTYSAAGTKYFCMGGKNKYYSIESDFTTKKSVSIAYNVFGGIIHCFRLFCIDLDDPYILRWSGPEMVDWTDDIYGGGYLRLNAEGGKMLSLCTYEDDILILREGGITILHALGDPRNYRISPTQMLIPVQNIICAGGVQGDKYYFLCKDGVHCFDGEKVTKVFYYPKGDITYTSLDVLSDGVLYIGCTIESANYIIAFRPSDESYTLFGKDCSNPVYLSDGLHLIYDTKLYKISPSSHDQSSLWRSQKFNLGTANKKTLKRISVTASSDIIVKVYADGAIRSFSGSGVFYVGERAKEFYFELSSGDNVSALSAEFEVIK